MSTLKTSSALRGFLVPNKIDDSSIWPAHTTAEQSGPLAGFAEPQQSSAMQLITAGDQAGLTDITVTTQNGGSPASPRRPCFEFGATGGSTSYGRDAAATISEYDPIVWKAGADDFKNPNVLALEEGHTIVAYEAHVSGNRTLKVVKRDRINGSWVQKLTTIAHPTGATWEIFPSLVRLEDDSIVLIYWTESSTNNMNMGAYRSTDLGESWSLMSYSILKDDVDSSTYSLGAIKLAYSRGQIMMIAELIKSSGNERDKLGQWFSIDGGVSFNQVGILTNNYYRPHLYTDIDGSFVIAYISLISAGNSARIFKFSNAASSLDLLRQLDEGTALASGADIAYYDNVAKRYTFGELAAWRDDDGTHYVLISDTAGGAAVDRAALFMLISRDLETWNFAHNATTKTDAYVYFTGDSGVNYTLEAALTRMSCASIEGRQIIVSNHISSGTSYDASITAIYLGGYTNRTLPELTNNNWPHEQLGFDHHYFPFDRPSLLSLWGGVGTGADAVTTAGTLQILTTGVQTQYFTATPSASFGDGFIVRARVNPNLGGANTTLQRGIQLRLADGANSTEISLRISQTELELWDDFGAAQIGSSFTYAGGVIDVLISFYSDKVFAWHRASIDDNKSNWTLLASSAALTDNGAGTPAGNRIYWGHIGAAAMTTNWFEFAYTVGSSSHLLNTTTDIRPRAYPPHGTYIYLDGGCRLTTLDSPARIADAYRIRTRYQYPLERMLFSVSPSPRIKWRSTTSNSQELAFYASSGSSDSSRQGNMTALYLGGINFYEFNVAVWLGAAWSSLGSFDVGAEMSWVHCLREGNTLTAYLPPNAASKKVYLAENEAADWTVKLEDFTTGAVKYRRVHSNTAGLLGYATGSGAEAIIRLEGIDGTEPTNVKAHLYPRECTVLISERVTYGAIKIEIPTTTTIEGYFEIGALTFGKVFVFAPQYGRGRSLSYEANTDISYTPDNQLRVYERSRGSQSVRISWTDAVDTTSFFDPTFSGNYYSSRSDGTAANYPIANFGDLPLSMINLYEYLRGAGKPIVYLSDIPRTTAAAPNLILNRAHQQLYSVTTSAVSIDSVLGEENTSEIFRISSLTISEIE